MKLLYGADKLVREWAEPMLPVKPKDGTKAIGFVRDNKLVGAALFDNYREEMRDVEFGFAGLPDRSWVCRKALAAIYQYAFGQLKCRRVTAYTKNPSAIKLLEDHLGFVNEGLMRELYPDGSDAQVFGLLRRDIPSWVGKYYAI